MVYKFLGVIVSCRSDGYCCGYGSRTNEKPMSGQDALQAVGIRVVIFLRFQHNNKIKITLNKTLIENSFQLLMSTNEKDKK